MKSVFLFIRKRRDLAVTIGLSLTLAALCIYFVFHGLAGGQKLLSAGAALPGLGLPILWGVSAACLITAAILGKRDLEALWLSLCLMALCAYLVLLEGRMSAGLGAAFLWAIEGFFALKQAYRRGTVSGALALPMLLFAWYVVVLLYDLAMGG